MKKDIIHELPLRSKVAMAEAVVDILHYLQEGNRPAADPLIEELKARSVQLDDKVQQDVLIFAEQVHFQYAYDPWHKITEDVRHAADQLIHDLDIEFLLS